MILYTGNIKQILQINSLHKETDTTVMMLYKNMKAIGCSPDGDNDFFNIVTGVLQGDTLMPYTFIICQDCVLKMSMEQIKENGFSLKRQETDNILQKLFRWYSPSCKYTWRSKDKLIRTIILWSSIHGCTSVGQLSMSYKHQLYVDTE